jgi:hypothetical protein
VVFDSRMAILRRYLSQNISYNLYKELVLKMPNWTRELFSLKIREVIIDLFLSSKNVSFFFQEYVSLDSTTFYNHVQCSQLCNEFYSKSSTWSQKVIE